jgi:hypothetical protein
MHVAPWKRLELPFMFVLTLVYTWYVQGTVVGRHAETGVTLSANHVYPVGGVPLWCITDTVCTQFEWVPIGGPLSSVTRACVGNKTYSYFFIIICNYSIYHKSQYCHCLTHYVYYYIFNVYGIIPVPSLFVCIESVVCLQRPCGH